MRIKENTNEQQMMAQSHRDRRGDAERKFCKVLPGIVSSNRGNAHSDYGHHPSPLSGLPYTAASVPTLLPPDFGRMYQDLSPRCPRSQHLPYQNQAYHFSSTPTDHGDRYSHQYAYNNTNNGHVPMHNFSDPVFNLYDNNPQDPLCNADEYYNRSNAPTPDMYLTDPLGADYINLKRYMEPFRESVSRSEASHRHPSMMSNMYGDYERMPHANITHDAQSKYPHGGHMSHSAMYPNYHGEISLPTYIASSRNQLSSSRHAPFESLQDPKSSSNNCIFPRSAPSVPLQNKAFLRPEAVMRVASTLHEKYWRNGRKNLQCFPNCQAYGDYSRIELHDSKKHDFMWGKCRGSVQVEISLINTQAMIDDIIVLCRIHSVMGIACRFEEAVSQESLSGRSFDPAEMEQLKNDWIIGEETEDRLGHKSARMNFKPKVWKYLDDDGLTKCKRRHRKYYVQFEAFVLTERRGHHVYLGIGSAASTPFDVGSSRVLARQKRKLAVGSSKSDASELYHSAVEGAQSHDAQPICHAQNLMHHEAGYRLQQNASCIPRYISESQSSVGTKRKFDDLLILNDAQDALLNN